MRISAWLLVVGGCAAAAGACETEDLPLGQAPPAGDAGDDGDPGGSAPTAGNNSGGTPSPRGGTGGTSTGGTSTGGNNDAPPAGSGGTGGGGENGGAAGEPSMLDCGALELDEDEGTALLSVDQFCEFVERDKPCPQTYDEAIERMTPQNCSDGNTSFQLRQGCGTRTVEWNGGLFGYSYSYDTAGNLVGASRFDDVAWGPCEELNANHYVAGEAALDCDQATTCQPCGTPAEPDESCSDSGVDCKDGKVSDLAGFCRTFSEFFPGVTPSGDCPATLDEAKALFEPSCSAADAIDLEYTTGCGFELITLRFANERSATLTYQDGELARANVRGSSKPSELGFGPCDDERIYYWAGASTASCADGWSACSRCSQSGSASELEDCPDDSSP
jgi:hypothetical protein